MCQNGIYGGMVNLLEEFLSNRRQKVIMNGECFSWPDIPFAALQYFIVWPVLFLIIINDLSFELKSKCKLFADDTCLFSVVHDVAISKNDWPMIYDWVYQWKVKFNPDLCKQAQEIIFSRKVSKSFRLDVHFENNPVNFYSISLQTCWNNTMF